MMCMSSSCGGRRIVAAVLTCAASTANELPYVLISNALSDSMSHSTRANKMPWRVSLLEKKSDKIVELKRGVTETCWSACS